MPGVAFVPSVPGVVGVALVPGVAFVPSVPGVVGVALVPGVAFVPRMVSVSFMAGVLLLAGGSERHRVDRDCAFAMLRVIAVMRVVAVIRVTAVFAVIHHCPLLFVSSKTVSSSVTAASRSCPPSSNIAVTWVRR